MNRWHVIGAIFFGALFVLFSALRLDVFDSRAMRILAAVFLFGVYCGIVAFGTAEKKRSLSLLGQTTLGVAAALAIAALIGPSLEAFGIAVLLGLVLGFTADMWVAHVPLP